MSEETTGGTPETQVEPKTYTEDEVKALIAGARKEGETGAYRHWQSVSDKTVAAERVKNSQLAKELQEARDRAFQALSPDEQNKALWEEIKARQQPVTEPPAPSANDDVAVVRASINTAIKDAGLDPAKIDWADDATGPDALKRFLASVVAQTSKPASKPTPQDIEANRVEAARSVGGPMVDLKSIDATALITSGLSKQPRD